MQHAPGRRTAVALVTLGPQRQMGLGQSQQPNTAAGRRLCSPFCSFEQWWVSLLQNPQDPAYVFSLMTRAPRSQIDSSLALLEPSTSISSMSTVRSVTNPFARAERIAEPNASPSLYNYRSDTRYHNINQEAGAWTPTWCVAGCLGREFYIHVQQTSSMVWGRERRFGRKKVWPPSTDLRHEVG